MMKARRAGDGSLVTVAGGSCAAVWVVTIGGRLLLVMAPITGPTTV
jgi:hypothetical protein